MEPKDETGMTETRSSTEEAGQGRLALEPRLAGQDAAAFVEAMQARRGGPLEVDASRVAEIGSPCVQVLLSAAESWRADGAAFAVVAPSPAFLATIGHLGLGIEAFRAGGAA